MTTVAFFTTTRAEYGICLPLLRAIEGEESLRYLLFAGGSHLSNDHGRTISEIEDSGAKITATFDYLEESYDLQSVGRGLAEATRRLTDIFSSYEFDIVCVTGDRYELLAIISIAILARKLIVHLHGGERTEGAIDDQIRHMVTKAAHLHFVICDEYATNIKRLGEEEWRIHNTGALAIDNILANGVIPKEELYGQLGLDVALPLVLLTYHPVTMEDTLTSSEQINPMFDALAQHELQVLVTAPNVEVDADQVVESIRARVSENRHYHYVKSLGANRYHSIIKHCEFVIGNSSSGIIEVPFFRKPTVNIGARQKGRFRHPSVIDTDYTREAISHAILKARSAAFRDSISGMEYGFGSGNAARRMIDILVGRPVDRKLLRKKLVVRGLQ